MTATPRKKGKCTNKECGEFPYYGVGPHTCYFRRGPQFKIGQSKMMPRSKWPKNFVSEAEGAKTGVWYCPVCLWGKP